MEKSWGKDVGKIGEDVGKFGEDVGKIEERWGKCEKIGERGGECWRKVFEKRLAIVFN